MLDDIDVFVVRRPISQAIEIFFPARWVVTMDWMGDFVEVESHEHRAYAQTVVAMKMGDENSGDNGRGYIGENELTLGSLSRIEEQPFVIPSK